MEDKKFEEFKKEVKENGYTVFIRAKKEVIHSILTDYMVEKRYLDGTLLISYREIPMDILGLFDKVAKAWPSEKILFEVEREQDHSMISSIDGELIPHSRFYPPFIQKEIENDRNWIMSEYLGYSNEYQKMTDEERNKMLSIIECFKDEKSYDFLKEYLEGIMDSELDRETAFKEIEDMLNRSCKGDIARFYQNLKVAKIMGGIVANPYIIK